MTSKTKEVEPNEIPFSSPMYHVLEHLEKAIDGAKELEKAIREGKYIESNNVVKDIEIWKERAILAENKNKQMLEEVEKLKKEKESLQFRIKKMAVSRDSDIHMIKNLKISSPANKFESSGFSQSYKSFQDLTKDSNDNVTADNKEIRKLLGDKKESFRHKWNKASISHRIQGIELNEEESIGESTAAARKYLNGMLGKNDQMYIPNEVFILEAREDERSV